MRATALVLAVLASATARIPGADAAGPLPPPPPSPGTDPGLVGEDGVAAPPRKTLSEEQERGFLDKGGIAREADRRRREIQESLRASLPADFRIAAIGAAPAEADPDLLREGVISRLDHRVSYAEATADRVMETVEAAPEKPRSGTGSGREAPGSFPVRTLGLGAIAVLLAILGLRRIAARAPEAVHDPASPAPERPPIPGGWTIRRDLLPRRN